MNDNYQNGRGYRNGNNNRNFNQNRGFQNQNGNFNNQSEEKVYLGNMRQFQRKNGDQFLCGTICIDDLESPKAQAHIFTGKNGKRYLKIVVNPYYNGPNEFKNTHSISVDTFRPQNSGNNGNFSGVNNFQGNDFNRFEDPQNDNFGNTY